MIAGGDAFRPAVSPVRLTALLLIASAHLAVVAAVAMLGGTVALVREAKPLFVQFVPVAPQPPALPATRVPLPALRAPEIQLPMPPAIEIAMHMEQRIAPAAAHTQTTQNPTMVSEAQAPAAAPPAQPPRFDLAYLNNPAPAYPPISRRLREEGRVVLRVLVNASGLVDAIEVMTTSGHARLDETALAAVRRWKFVPARAGEQAVAGWAIVPVAFNLQG